MATQNLTVSLDPDTIRRAKVLAAARGVSVSRLVSDLIGQMVGEAAAYEAAMREALAILDTGYDLGGTVTSRREEWHDRAALR
jgi:hypothetical protein